MSYRFDKPWRVQVNISRHDYRNEYVFSNTTLIDVHIVNTISTPVTLKLAAGYMEAAGMTQTPDKKVDQFPFSSNESKDGKIFTRSPLFSAFTDNVPRVVKYDIRGTVMTVAIL